MTPRPTAIDASKSKKEMIIKWDDDHVSTYSFTMLRTACPCAECRGGHDNMGGPPDPGVFTLPIVDTRETSLNNIVATGTYGVTLVWEDGHDYGIYNWGFLRELCPCDECRK
jgi:DUF971 family protein